MSIAYVVLTLGGGQLNPPREVQAPDKARLE